MFEYLKLSLAALAIVALSACSSPAGRAAKNAETAVAREAVVKQEQVYMGSVSDWALTCPVGTSKVGTAHLDKYLTSQGVTGSRNHDSLKTANTTGFGLSAGVSCVK